jgi:hypothetical protein
VTETDRQDPPVVRATVLVVLLASRLRFVLSGADATAAVSTADVLAEAEEYILERLG